MFDLANLPRMTIAIVGAMLLTSATVFAAAAPAEVAPSAAYASVQSGANANG